MPDTRSNTRDPVPFRAMLTPHRSLGPKGFLVLMAAVSLVSFVIGLVFWSMGAWPVTAFFGLDVALIYVAFKLNYKSGQMYETIDLAPDTLILTRVDPAGRREILEFNPYWVRVHLDEDTDGRTRLSLVSRGKSHIFARFLSNEERSDFFRVLSEALQRSRAAPGTV